jgi:tripartite ATP-independent transporter DctM subunit
MDWVLPFCALCGGVLFLLFAGVPVAFSFMFVTAAGAWVLWNGDFVALVLSAFKSVGNFSWVPIPFFILMGEAMFHSGVAVKMMDVLSSWMGRIPGRLSLLAVAGGTVFATMTGSGAAGTAMLGSMLAPEMEKRGYKKTMILGPIMASGGLAVLIPPTVLGVVQASLAGIPVGKFLIGLVLPGLLTAAVYAAYIIVRCWLQPELTPGYEIQKMPFLPKIAQTARYVLPMLIIIFVIIGLMFLGLATPTEAAALGALTCFIIGFIYGGKKKETISKSFNGAARISFMMLMLIVSASAFSELLAYTGAIGGLASLVTRWEMSPIMVVILMQAVMFVMGTALESIGIMLVCTPIFFPIIQKLGLDPLWFGIIMLINMETASISPPYGLQIFVMKGVASADTTLGDVLNASWPFCGLNCLVMGLIIAFPGICTWLPNLMIS